MAGKNGNQDLWIVGSRAYFQREGRDSLVELGVINVVSPSVEITKIDLREFETGLGKLYDSSISEFSESYEITTKNFYRENVANLFLSSDAEERVNPSEGATSNLAIFAFTYDTARHPVGTTFVAVDNGGTTPTGQVCYNIASLSPQGALSGNITLVDAARGIFSLSNNAGLSNGSTYTVNITLSAPITNNRQLMKPQNGGLSRVTGEMFLYFERNNGADQSCRNFKTILTPTTANFQIEDYSEFTFTARALLGNVPLPTATNPAGDNSTNREFARFGRYVQYAGDAVYPDAI